jgi:hypothetical protein
MPYEIVDGDGRCLYRGNDLELACKIHDQDRSAQFVVLSIVDSRPSLYLQREESAASGTAPLGHNTSGQTHDLVGLGQLPDTPFSRAART